MIRIENDEPFRWLRTSLDRTTGGDDPNWRGNFVSHVLPKGYAAYCKIFHPIYVDSAIKDRGLSWNQAPEAQSRLDAMSAEIRSVLANGVFVRGSSDQSVSGEGVTWRELARQLKLVYHPALSEAALRRAFAMEGSWPRYLLGPYEGTLDVQTCEALVDILGPFTGATECFFRYSDFWKPGEPYLYSGRLDELPALVEAQDGWSPEYWWLSNQAWCVCTDWDLLFTLVAGPESLIRPCQENCALECIQVEIQTRIDNLSDEVNTP